MGVKGLWQLLQPVARPVKLEMLGGKRVAIDSSIWLYHFLRAIKDKQGHTLTNAHILGFLRRILKLLFYGLKPVFVFDGGAPRLKKTTISERKNRRQGARQSHALIASRLLSAQLRKAAIQQQQRALSVQSKGTAKRSDDSDNDDNVAYLDDLNNVAPKKQTPQKKRRLDPYELPAVPSHPKSNIPDPRLATEDELRDFISTMKPSDFDTSSEAFKQLPPEVQYELIGDMRLKSRSTSFSRLETMLRKSSTAKDFSKAQIQNLMQRNDLTQKLINHSEGMGKDEESPVALRVSTSRNKEYFLMRKSDNEGGGWVLGIQDSRGQPGQKPIEISSDHEDGEEQHISEDTDEDDMDMEEVSIPPAEVSDVPAFNEDGSQIPHVYDTFEENEAQLTGLDAALDESMITKAKEDSLRMFTEMARRHREKEKATDSIENQPDSLKDVRGVSNAQATQKLGQMQPNVTRTITKPPEQPSSQRKATLKHTPARPQEDKREKLKLQDFQSRQSKRLPERKSVTPEDQTPLFLDEDEENDVADMEEVAQIPSVDYQKKNYVSEPIDKATSEKQIDIVKIEKHDTDLNLPQGQGAIFKEPHKAPQKELLDSDVESAYSGWEESPPPQQPPQTTTSASVSQSTSTQNEKQLDELHLKDRSSENKEMSPPIDIDASDNEIEAIEAIENEEKDYIAFSSTVNNKNYDEMLAEADLDIRRLQQSAKKMSGGSDDPTMQMTGEIQKLLRAFGIPYITAPMEAEAQCAKLAQMNLVDAVITDDSDVFLFGAPIVYKNMFNDRQFVECYVSSDIERDLSLSRDRLIELAHILGSDYTNGFPGVGPVMAMELLADFAHENTLVGFRDWWIKVQNGKDTSNDTSTRFRKNFKKKSKNLFLDKEFPDPQVKGAYYGAKTDSSNEEFVWGIPNLDELREYLYNYLGWPAHKVDDTIIPVMKHMRNKKAAPQTSLDRYFDDTVGAGVLGPRPMAAYSSNRLKEVVKAFRGRNNSETPASSGSDSEEADSTKKKKKQPAKPRKRTQKPARVASKRKKDTSEEDEASDWEDEDE
ncbi:PIN domain-like protein [Wallemia mellicola]|nr:PIN domain-like protein [Wallemia mellicola]TIC22079.1 PIN domain-like protein [Wallemia mellicola]